MSVTEAPAADSPRFFTLVVLAYTSADMQAFLAAAGGVRGFGPHCCRHSFSGGTGAVLEVPADLNESLRALAVCHGLSVQMAFCRDPFTTFRDALKWRGSGKQPQMFALQERRSNAPDHLRLDALGSFYEGAVIDESV